MLYQAENHERVFAENEALLARVQRAEVRWNTRVHTAHACTHTGMHCSVHGGVGEGLPSVGGCKKGDRAVCCAEGRAPALLKGKVAAAG